MPKTITTTAVRALMSDGVRFVDVLPASAYAEERIAGAVNLALADIDEAPARFGLDEPIVVYCGASEHHERRARPEHGRVR